MNYKVFFDRVRRHFPIKTAVAVQNYEKLIEEGLRRGAPLTHIAYVLATAYWETAKTMEPISERGSPSYFDKYNAGTRLGKVLGNTKAGDGIRYKGRGFVQITGRSNYKKFGIEDTPEHALNADVATDIIWTGMTNGTFTGKKMADYLDGPDPDWTNARRIVNGTDRADTIGGFGKLYLEALLAAQEAKPVVVPKTPTQPNAPLAVVIITIILGGAALILKNVLGL